MVADPLGPDIVIERSALPEAPLVSMLPLTKNPASIGSPSNRFTSSFAFALSRASLYGSDDLMAPKASSKMSVPPPQQTTMGVRQPTGTTHFQFRFHQDGFGAWSMNFTPSRGM